MGFGSFIKKALKKAVDTFTKPFQAVRDSVLAIVSPKLGAATAAPLTVPVKSADRLRQQRTLSRSNLLAGDNDADGLTEEYLGLPGNYPNAPVTLGSVHRQRQTLGS